MEYEVNVWHDQSGRIIAWGYVNPKTPIAISATPVSEHGQEILTARVSQQDLSELHESYYVDCSSKQLVRRKSAE
jgi:hypothetical protein